MANDIRALFQQLEIEKVSMIGHDWGAPLPACQRPPAISIGWSHHFSALECEGGRGHWFFILKNLSKPPFLGSPALASYRSQRLTTRPA
jgi:hypothetical protein